MPIYRLTSALSFPSPRLAEPDGLLAIGGDLSAARLLLAYSLGIFPWYNPGEPILWWSPDPRCVLFPGDLILSRSLRKELRRQRYTITIDGDFASVMHICAEVRLQDGAGTWIGEEMQAAYRELHEMGYAHSLECWQAGSLVGGLYGVALGSCFFGESMFHRQRDASKVAFALLARTLFASGYTMIDCQLPTPHLQSLGARVIDREAYLAALSQGDVNPRYLAPAPFPDRVLEVVP